MRPGDFWGMIKRIGTWLLGVWLACMPAWVFAQGKVYFEQSGRPSGSVSAVELNGLTYVDVQRTARKLGAQVELFAASKQAKITTKGFFAILTAPLNEIIVNGQHQPIAGEVVVRGGKLMAPAQVFTLPAFQQAVNKYISFQDNTFVVERRFNVDLADTQLSAQEDLLVFESPNQITYETAQPNVHTVLVTLKDTVLKRDIYKRLHTDFIASAHAQQARTDTQLKVILGPKAKDWSFTPQADGRWVFRAAAAPGKPQLASKPTPVMTTEPAPLAISAAEKEKTPKPATGGLAAIPSVLQEDEFEEMDLSALQELAPQPTVPANTPVTKPAPVIKAEPHPLAITAVHKKMRIVVDPGHGGKDAGAVRGKYREKDWNLAVGKELARLLKKGNFDVKITRETDTFIALSDRSKMANNFKADLFVSVHVNATQNSKANGFQVYFRSEKATDKEAAETAALENEAMQYEEVHYNFVDALLQSLAKNEYINESSKLAGYMKNAVHKQPGIGIAVDQKNCIRQANFYVLKGVQSPAVLVEMGFISSPKDRARLSQGSVQKKMAQGIYNGIVSYAKQEGWLK